MQFTYTYLKNAENNDIQVGSWKGMPVYACSKHNLPEYPDDEHVYLIYDDENLLYYKGRVYATVSANGNVSEFNSRRYTTVAFNENKKKKEEALAAGGEAPTAAVSTPSIEGDVALGLLVEDTLKNARTMTIDSLLEGFDYGLD